jgi:hypothetical protein
VGSAKRYGESEEHSFFLLLEWLSLNRLCFGMFTLIFPRCDPLVSGCFWQSFTNASCALLIDLFHVDCCSWHVGLFLIRQWTQPILGQGCEWRRFRNIAIMFGSSLNWIPIRWESWLMGGGLVLGVKKTWCRVIKPQAVFCSLLPRGLSLASLFLQTTLDSFFPRNKRLSSFLRSNVVFYFFF